MRSSELTLNADIQQHFRNRVVVTFALLFVVGGIFSFVEVWFSALQLKDRLTANANQLKQQLLSEILVDNHEAAAAILKDANEKSKTYTITWKADNLGVETAQFRPMFPAAWVYDVPMKAFGDSRYGVLSYQGKFLKQPEIASILVGKLLLILVVCGAIAMLIMPLAQRIPNEVIVSPIRDLLDLLRADDLSVKTPVSIRHKELRDIFSDFQITIARKRQLEDERVEMQKMITVTDTAQMLAHDMRKPFNLVRMVMQSLQGAKSWEATQNFINTSLPGVHRALNQLDDMLRELVDVGKDPDLNLEPIEASGVIYNVVQQLRLQSGNSNVGIATELTHHAPIWADKAQFTRAISNILLNALQAANEGGKIWIKSRQYERTGKLIVEFCIGNTGSFIPDEDRQRIFNIFYTNGKKGGTGLGLAIAQKVARSHGGNIWCDSSVTHGTEFFLTIPSAAPEETIATKRTKDQNDQPRFSSRLSTALRDKALKALIVDDEPFYSEHAAEILANLGHQIDFVKCADSASAISAARDFTPDIVICDVELGKNSLDGHELVSELRRSGIKSFIHVHTNRMFNSDDKRAKDAGADQFAQKPFTTEIAQTILRQVTAGI